MLYKGLLPFYNVVSKPVGLVISIHLLTKCVLQQTHLIYAWTPQLQAILQESVVAAQC